MGLGTVGLKSRLHRSQEVRPEALSQVDIGHAEVIFLTHELQFVLPNLLFTVLKPHGFILLDHC